MALLQRALGGFPNYREGGGHDVVERLASGDRGSEFIGLRPQLLVAQGLEFRLERIDFGDLRPVALESTVVGRTEHPLHDGVELQGAEHLRPFKCRPRGCRRALLRSVKAADDDSHNKRRETRQNARFRAAQQDWRWR